MDLREDEETLTWLQGENEKPITFEQGVEAAKKIGAVKYLECSSLKGVGVEQVFDTAFLEAAKYLHGYGKDKKEKCILS